MRERVKTSLAVLFPMMVVLPFITAGLCGPDPSEDPCETDPFGCQSTGSFEYDESCELTGVLEVELGHGEDGFISFDEQAVPRAYSGSQGGQHMFLALRVRGADLERYSKLRAEFRMTTPIPGCTEDATASETGEGDAFGGDSCDYLRAQREVVLGEVSELRVGADGYIEEDGIILFDVGGSEPNTLSVVVEDPCRRSGEDSTTFTR